MKKKVQIYLFCVLFCILFSLFTFADGSPAFKQLNTQEKAVQKILILLKNGKYEKGLALADELWAGWRHQLISGAAAFLKQKKSSDLHYSTDPKIWLVPRAVCKQAREILSSISAITDKKAVPYLLMVRDKELAGHVLVTAYKIGSRLYQSDRVACAQIVSQVLRAWEKTKPINPELKRMECILDRGARLRTDVLGDLLSGGSSELLLALYKDSRDWQMNITRQIIQAAASDHRPKSFSANFKKKPKNPVVLLAALSDDDPRIRKFAAARLSNHAIPHSYWINTEKIKKALIQMLKDPDFGVQVEAAHSLARYKVLDAFKYVIKQDISALSKITDPYLGGSISFTMIMMGQVHFTQGTDWLIKAGRKDRRNLCLEAFWRMRDPRVVRFLGEFILNQNETTSMRTYAVAALARTMNRAAFPYLKKAYEKALKKKNAEMVRACLAALPYMHPDLSFDILWQAMSRYRAVRKSKKMTKVEDKFGGALYNLYSCSGYIGSEKQMTEDQELIKKRMKDFWSGLKKLLDFWDRLRGYRFIEQNPKKEKAAWYGLEELVKKLPWPVRKRALQSIEFYWKEMESLDCSLKIYKRVETIKLRTEKEHGLLIEIEETGKKS